MNKILKIINEEIHKLDEYLTREGVSLIKYFSMSDEEKMEYLPEMYPFEYLFDRFIDETNIQYNRKNYIDVHGDEIESDEEFSVYDLPHEIKEKYSKWLYSKILNGNLDGVDYSEYPAWSFFSHPTLIKNQWLIHFTDDAQGIANNGFIYGVDDIDKLGLTTQLSDFDKKYGGYNFAYLLTDFMKYGKTRQGWSRKVWKYGNEAVVFRASGVKLWHSGDEEPQVIFYGNTAQNIIPIVSGEKLSYGLFSNKTNELLYESDELEKIVDWIVKNYDQYRKHLYNK